MDCRRTTAATAVFTILAAVAPTYAVEFVVTRFDDPTPNGCAVGDCSLREAVIDANITMGPDDIIMPSGVYALMIAGAEEDDAATGDIDITDDVTISGAGINTTIIGGSNLDRVFDIDPTENDITVNFFDLLIRHGSANGNGGGIRNFGVLNLTRIAVTDNFATDFGGGIASSSGANLTATECIIELNRVASGAAGIFNSSASLTVVDSQILDNEVLAGGSDGGGVYTVGSSSTLVISGSTISGNTADNNGGGIHASATQSIYITDSEISDNFAGSRGGGMRDFGTGEISITRSSFLDNQAPTNHGGGMYLVAGENSPGEVYIRESTFSGNHSGAGGGGLQIGAHKSLTVHNTTVSGNSATEEGGGIYISGIDAAAYISHTTITNNTADSDNDFGEPGGGLFATGNLNNVRFANTIIAGNFDGGGDPDCSGLFIAEGGNLIGDFSAGCVITDASGGLIADTDPMLLPLADNGGPTLTHSIPIDSPAIDTGDNGSCLTIDQRGEPRPQDADNDGANICDLGAVERSAPAAAPPNNNNGFACGASLGMVAPAFLFLALGFLKVSPSRGRRLARTSALRIRAVGVLILSFAFANHAFAVELSVTRTDDPVPNGCAEGDCSLREAVMDANEFTGLDTITLPAGVYTLQQTSAADSNDGILNTTSGDLDITDDLAITGAGREITIIDANGIDRVFDIDLFQDGVSVQLSDLTVRDGTAFGDGNGIRNQGNATLTRVSVKDNTGGSSSYGGGIYNDNGATLALIDSAVQDNETDGPGGGISSYNSTLTIEDSTVTGNSTNEYGGGVISSGGFAITISRSVIANNSAAFEGGGVHTNNDESLVITESLISGNNATQGGGVYSNGTDLVAIRTTTINTNTSSDRPGGGIFAGRTANLNIADSTISNNVSTSIAGGVGIGNKTEMSMVSSTISGNAADFNGGGVYVSGEDAIALIHFSTITNNTADANNDGEGGGGGIATAGNAFVRMSNTILAGNVDPAGDPDCLGEITNDGFNLIETVSAGCELVGDPTGDIYGADPRLGPLANNGGPTDTHALLNGSPAIDKGGPEFPPFDQRSRPRATDGDNDGSVASDIGAFEKAALGGRFACGASLGMVTPLLMAVGLMTLSFTTRGSRRPRSPI